MRVSSPEISEGVLPSEMTLQFSQVFLDLEYGISEGTTTSYSQGELVPSEIIPSEVPFQG